MAYDCTDDTRKHMFQVKQLVKACTTIVLTQVKNHDASKLEEPEKSLFDIYTPKLKEMKFGTDEYNACLKELKVALDHHYAANSHHPEHYENGISGMDLFDVIEMFCDWLASCSRMEDGNIYKSIDFCQKRFGFSDELKSILTNTVGTLKEHLDTDPEFFKALTDKIMTKP
jgi:hypothetical protein